MRNTENKEAYGGIETDNATATSEGRTSGFARQGNVQSGEGRVQEREE